tara:strand:+ start:4251 stop:4754 length:504 start_codon:yes stop_codon:yes gene_type:complete
MRKLKILFILIFFLAISCQETNKALVNQDIKIKDFEFSPPVKLVSISTKYRIRNNIFNWPEFTAFTNSFENLTKLNPEGILVFIEELELKLKVLSKSNFPKKLDLPDIKSRLKVVQTMLLQSKYHSKNKDWKSLDESLRSLYTSYNSFIDRIKSINEEINLFSSENN